MILNGGFWMLNWLLYYWWAYDAYLMVNGGFMTLNWWLMEVFDEHWCYDVWLMVEVVLLCFLDVNGGFMMFIWLAMMVLWCFIDGWRWCYDVWLMVDGGFMMINDGCCMTMANRGLITDFIMANAGLMMVLWWWCHAVLWSFNDGFVWSWPSMMALWWFGWLIMANHGQ